MRLLYANQAHARTGRYSPYSIFRNEYHVIGLDVIPFRTGSYGSLPIDYMEQYRVWFRVGLNLLSCFKTYQDDIEPIRLENFLYNPRRSAVLNKVLQIYVFHYFPPILS
jgi:hypothetical protein